MEGDGALMLAWGPGPGPFGTGGVHTSPGPGPFALWRPKYECFQHFELNVLCAIYDLYALYATYALYGPYAPYVSYTPYAPYALDALNAHMPHMPYMPYMPHKPEAGLASEGVPHPPPRAPPPSADQPWKGGQTMQATCAYSSHAVRPHALNFIKNAAWVSL